MSDDTPVAEIDVTRAWHATQSQKGAANRLRIFAALSWIVAIGAEIAGLVMLKKHKFDHGNFILLIGIIVVIAVFAIAGNLIWKSANKKDPASKSDTVRFFMQNQLGAIITLVAFVPLVVLIFMDKDMDPKNKKIAVGVGAIVALGTLFMGIDFNTPSIEQYTQDMNQCASQIRSGKETTACSPEVAAQAQDIARDTKTISDATKDAQHPNGLDIVYWIAPVNGLRNSSKPHVFHVCESVSPLRGKTVNHGSVTEAYAQNAKRITKQIAMEQAQCGIAAPH
jgi:hypothetical protein